MDSKYLQSNSKKNDGGTDTRCQKQEESDIDNSIINLDALDLRMEFGDLQVLSVNPPFRDS